MGKNNFLSKLKAFISGHPVIAGFIGMFIVGVMLVWISMIFLGFWTHHGDNVTVPEIKRMSYADAERTLNDCNLAIEISDSIYDTSIPAGTVIESWPKSGSVVKNGRSVYVTVTAFSPKHVTLSMPVTGVSSRQAVSYLNALGIKGIRFVSVPSEYPDLVESAHYDGRPLGVGSTVPVDATIVLEVGMAVVPVETEETDTISSEDAVVADFAEYSTYEDDEE